MDHLQSAFYILAIGIAVIATAFLAEISYYRWLRNDDDLKRPSNVGKETS